MIRLRAWDKVHKRWGKPGLICGNKERCCMIRPVMYWSAVTGIVELPQHDWSWLPSTGFFDRDGTEIFRGDIVVFGGRESVVGWDPDQGWHDLAFQDRRGRSHRLHLNAGLASCVAVVGTLSEGKNYSPVGASR